ncbi:MAG: hypothetical protein HOV77_06210 [Hamadaea sp.]|uniref:hypothetical protein n=1 Tax=Hamadaea sp. TaxID=2024425 RepID=UPI00184A8FEB|nr:hypothetical protein [Hamadaea sp.]NUT18760.1 hypothetical protein [Hamadaea sp.]
MSSEVRRTRQYRLHLAGLRLALSGILTCGVSAVLGEVGHLVTALVTVLAGFVLILYGLLLTSLSLMAIRDTRGDLSIWATTRCALRDLLGFARPLDRP